MFSPLLAFGFGNPFLLWGLALLAVPWLLHLLTKRQYRSTEWAAMRFLLEAMRKNSRRIRLEQLILLLLRTALIALIVLGLSRPLWTTAGPLLGGFEPVQRLIILDASYSMGLETAGNTLFQRAQSLARELVAGSRQGDAFQLLQLSQTGSTVLIGEPAYRKEDVLGELERAPLSPGGAELPPLLETLPSLLEKCPEISRKQIYFYTDLQKLTWDPSGESADRTSKLLQELSAKARLVLVDVGIPESSNLGVTGVRLSESFVTPEQDLQVQATLRSYGASGEASPLVELWSDGQLIAQQQVSLAAGSETAVVFPLRFTSGGWHRLRIKLPADRLPADDERVLAVEVKSEIRVLCVNGRPSGDERDSAVYFLSQALAPASDQAAPRSLVRPNIIEGAELRNYDLNGYDVVFLCNIPTFDESETVALASYLQSGGVVVFTLGDRVQPAEYRRLLAEPAQMLLPAPLAERQGNAARKEQIFHFSTADLSHPALKVFQGNPASGLGTTPLFEYFRVSQVPSGVTPPRVILSYANGDPALLEREVGQGRSLLFTSTFDESWGNFAIWPSFLPFIQELVRYAVAANRPQTVIPLGQSLTIPNPLSERLQLRKPDGSTLSLGEETVRGAGWTFGGTNLPGFYEVSTPGGELRQLFGVTVPAAEGNLEKLSRAEVSQGLLASVEFDYQTEAHRETAVAGKPAIRTVEPARWLIFAALYLIFVELVMAWNFRWGLSLLFPPLIPVWLVRSGFRR